MEDICAHMYDLWVVMKSYRRSEFGVQHEFPLQHVMAIQTIFRHLTLQQFQSLVGNKISLEITLHILSINIYLKC